ncbi:hypothetical protein AALB53_04660 [Lachnospiraceae bacterium 47-T17]
MPASDCASSVCRDGAIYLLRENIDEREQTIIGITGVLKEYESLPYGEFKKQTGREAELYHTTLFCAEIPDSSIDIIYNGEYDEAIAGAALADEAMPIRLQGPLHALLDGVKEEMPLTEFAKALSADGAAEAVVEQLEGGGTAYYVGNKYVQIQFDSDKNGKYDRNLLISLDESTEETIIPESVAWLEMRN